MPNWVKEEVENKIRYRCNELYNSAKSILGNAVADAYYELDLDGCYNEEWFNKNLKQVKISKVSIDLVYDIPITFVLLNGKRFSVWTSEFGDIRSESE